VEPASGEYLRRAAPGQVALPSRRGRAILVAMGRATLTALSVIALALAGLAAADAGARARSGHAAPVDAARLAGTWTVTGSFVLVENLIDRRVGDRVNERWSLQPRCRVGACDVVLRRNGRSTVLRRRGSTYRGIERFTGAFRCNDRTYPRGTVYAAEWVVRVTAVRRSGGRTYATRFSGAGATVGRSTVGPPCPTVVSKEGVVVSGRRTS
jgi:hypothetical protein